MANLKRINFLSEVLATKDESLVVDIKQKVPVITSQIEKLKFEVKNYIESDDIFLVPKNVNYKFLKQVKNLNQEMIQLLDKVEEVSKKDIERSILDIENLKSELDETQFALKLTTELVNINDALRNQEQLKKEMKFLEAAQEIAFARKICDAIPKEEQLDLIKIIKENITIEAELLRENIISIWKRSVIIEKKEEGNETVCVQIKIDNATTELKQAMEAMYYENTLIYFNHIANFLLKEILVPIINHTVEIKELILEKDNYELLEIKILTKTKKMKYKEVFNNILTVVDFLCCKINYNLTQNLSFLMYIGNRIREEFCKEFIKNCLADTIPSTQEELEKYQEIVKEIESLQMMLVQWNFFDKDCVSILEYAGNVNSLFANKICQNYTEKARVILKKDLHDMIEIGDPNQSAENQKINDFPKCCVSRSALEYLNLARSMLEQAINSEGMCAGRLVYTVKQLFELYCIVIPQHHKKLLESIPQQVALFHNNCIYLAHELITYETYYVGRISKDAFNGENFDYPIHTLRQTGTEIFMKYINSQKKQIEDILKDSELSILSQIEKLNPNCEKNIRQCLRQLELLKTVWQKVLNYEVYNKSIGDLLNHFVDQLIKHVLNVEDISAETSTALVDMFKTVQNRGPNLFTEPKEINMYTNHWCKFNELILLLNSSLSDIYDRWADGKGPLAVEYSPEDIRRLIRALFQNTDRRAAVLGKIV